MDLVRNDCDSLILLMPPDVFMSDICTCRPYLCYGIEECAKEAQAGGAGVVIYFRKEGRALGEVLKSVTIHFSESLGSQLTCQVSRLQSEEADGRCSKPVLFVYRICCRGEGYALSRTDARYIALARCKED